MQIAEVAMLFKTIKRHYPSFDASIENVKHNHKYLRDFPFDVAKANLDEHIMTDRFPPTIADIRGRLGEQLERQRSKEESESYFANIEAWKDNAAAPPEGLREKIYAKLRGDSE